MASLRSRLTGVRLDITPVPTSRDVRLLLGAGTGFSLGGMVSYIALLCQLFQLTAARRPGAVGAGRSRAALTRVV